MLKSLLFIFFLLSSSIFNLYSQEKFIQNDFLYQEIKLKAQEYKDDINFYKAQYYFTKKNWDSTLVYSGRQLESNRNLALKDYCYYFRGFGFREKKLFPEAVKDFKKVSRKFTFYCKIQINLGEIALEQNKFKDALYYFHSAEKSENDNCNFKKSTAIHNIGLCYLHIDQFDKAEAYLFKASELQELEKDTLLLIGSYMDIANLYYNQFKDSQAIPYFEKAYKLATKVKSFELKQNATLNMAIVEENRKEFQKALLYRKEYESWRDSLRNQNKVWAVADLEKKFTVKQKQKEIDVLEAENRLKNSERNLFLTVSVFLLFLFGAGIYFYREKSRSNKIILIQKNELKELNNTKDKLFSIVSHDLRSSVNALKRSNSKLSENLENRNFSELDVLLTKNTAITNDAYNLLDNLLNWAILQTAQTYFYIESLHLHSIVEQVQYNFKALLLDKEISFENNVDEEVYILADLDSLKIIIRNLLDNAIKFTPPKGKISFCANTEIEEDFCYIIIEDSGIGISPSLQKEILEESFLLSKKRTDDTKGTGLGMQLCKNLISKNEGRLKIESAENQGTKFIIILPKSKKDG
ncbi:tetratricopeptide repeat-containing sensor histidine kinase [Flavobacterium mesophilum]|uniref:tetratricopeptide repeat-containing sensor histidine kinase n=1 Tax=Flavobacterium mesophilum TaxID=3143495 RepID=UPI0031E1E165